MQSPNELRLSPWLAKILIQKSPKHAYHAATNRGSDEPSASMRLGSAVDRLVFGVGDDIVIKTKRGQEAEPGQILVTDVELAQAQAIATCVAETVPDLRKGQIQPYMRWGWENVTCSGKPDHIDEDQWLITDLKTAHDLSDDGIVKSIELYGYDIQAAAYLDGAEQTYRWPSPRFRWVFVETDAPYDVRIIEPTLNMIQSGHTLWNKAKRIWKECITTGNWPGRGHATLGNSAYRRNRDNTNWETT
jgi:hypothetical protein